MGFIKLLLQWYWMLEGKTPSYTVLAQKPSRAGRAATFTAPACAADKQALCSFLSWQTPHTPARLPLAFNRYYMPPPGQMQQLQG